MTGATTDGDGWELEPGDEEGAAVMGLIGRQLRSWREASGLKASELGVAMGYGEGIVYKVESGARIPRPEFLDKADEVLNAGGRLSEMKEDAAKLRYPKKVRDLAEIEAKAVELTAYWTHKLPGLLQTPEYAQALFSMRRPALSSEQIERALAARSARKSIFERDPTPDLSFIQEEASLRRPIGGKMVLRRQLEHLLELAQLATVDIQVMPTGREDHAGMDGDMQVLKFRDGTAIGRCDGLYAGRPVSDPKQLRIIELRCGIIRTQALPPGESLAFIEQVLGEL
ncbi:helix-turn-helix domain-containing protein [Streptomyces sp. SID8379]|uniref:helix-turn-helix domain-containing protein n=1 Tax=unclassified Streptomyces TaxID=2593676 RepID=UPI0003655D86|nr:MULTISPECIES: helix-turn-helix transcriptional regulator [unclassified Streptomyces]MYW68750.1 helix-turn-helix domain-containing protein [Streptomyces sp. SID8379]